MSRFKLEVVPVAAASPAGILPAAQLMGMYRQLREEETDSVARIVPLVISVRDGGGNTVGGLMASTFGEWLMLQMVWLPDTARAQGYGRRLLAMAEEEAGCRGCRHAYVDASDPNHVTFFERCGYTVGMLDTVGTGAGQPFRLSKELACADVAAQ